MIAYRQENADATTGVRREMPAEPMRTQQSIQRDILRTLLYFDIFDFPLRLPEIYQYLPTNTVALADLRQACSSRPLRDLVSEEDGYFFLRERSQTIVDDRRQKEQRARYMWFAARLMARIIGAFPFVSAVLVSGELSKGVASRHSDIDFYLVTAPKRVWIVRSLCAAFKRLFLLNSKKFFCYNHIVTASGLAVAEKSFYSAVELVTLKPMWNKGFYAEILASNPWVKGFLPNWNTKTSQAETGVRKTPILERLIARFVSADRLDRLEEQLLHQWERAWDHRYPDLSKAKRGELFRCTQELSTSYVKDFYSRIVQEYSERLCRYGLLSTDVGVSTTHVFNPRGE